MKLYIPELGDKLTLTSNWKFKLYGEERNDRLLAFFGYKPLSRFSPHGLTKVIPVGGVVKEGVEVPTYGKWLDLNNYTKDRTNYLELNQLWCENVKDWWETTEMLNGLPITIPKNSVLTVDRIYVRKGKKDFSSISFYVLGLNGNKKYRFWAKLEDCNNINFK